jgi:hypothetical protein
MQKVNGELDKMEAKALKAGGSLGVMEKASKYSGVALMGLAGAFGVMAAAGIKAALNVADAQAKLKTAVQDTGVSFANFTPYMDQSVASMARFGFKSEDTITALAQMTAATRNPQTALDMLSTAADLAAFKHESLAAAADTVSRAAMGQARGLATLGIALGKTIPKGASVAQIMQAIQDRTKGAAAEAAKADPWKVLTAQFGLLEEKLGTALLPAFRSLSDWVIKTGLPALERIGKWISNNKGLFETLVTTLGLLWVAPKVDAMFTAIKGLATAWGFVATKAGEAAVAEEGAIVAAEGLGAFPFLVTAGLAYSQRKTPSRTAGAIKNFGLAASSGGMLGGATSNASSESYIMMEGPNGIGAVKLLTSQKAEIESYKKAGWKTTFTSGSSKKTLPGINSGQDISKIIAGNTKKTPKTKTTKTKSASIKSQETGVLSVNVYLDGTKAATQTSLYGGNRG